MKRAFTYALDLKKKWRAFSKRKKDSHNASKTCRLGSYEAIRFLFVSYETKIEHKRTIVTFQDFSTST